MSDAADAPVYRQFAARYARASADAPHRDCHRRCDSCAACRRRCQGYRILSVSHHRGCPRIGEYFGKLFSIVPQRGGGACSGAGILASVRRREGATVGRVLVLSLRYLCRAAMADHPDGGVGNGNGLHGRVRAVISGRAQPCGQRTGPLADAAIAGGNAVDSAGRAGVHPGLAIRHRSAGGHHGNRDPLNRCTRETVF